VRHGNHVAIHKLTHTVFDCIADKLDQVISGMNFGNPIDGQDM
jgi:hypothetical protein